MKESDLQTAHNETFALKLIIEPDRHAGNIIQKQG
jgi:hypothetical protein